MSWKGERRGFGERGFRSRPGGGNDRPRGFAAGEMRPTGRKGRGGNGSRVWEKRKVPRFRGDDYESPTAYFLSIKTVSYTHLTLPTNSRV